MAKLTANISARQLAGFQAETDKYNTEKTAEYSRRNPPEVWTPLTAEERFSERMAAVGDRHAEEFVKASREKTLEKIKEIPEADWATIKAAIDAKVPDKVEAEVIAEEVKP